MHLIDTALQKLQAENKPIRVGMIGAGFMAKGVGLQLISRVPGIHLACVSNRNIAKAKAVYEEAGAKNIVSVDSKQDLEDNIARQNHCITDNPELICDADNIDVVLEITGSIEFAAKCVFRSIQNGKHVVLMNAELDSTVGFILKKYADDAGVILTNVDGDQPGVIMNLYRFVKGMGIRPVMCGNVKGLQDPYRTPTTQAGFAKKWKQSPKMVTSFADGTKISFEQALVANATGMQVAQRGMIGPTVDPGTHINNAAEWYPHNAMLTGAGIVDYVVQAEPGPGVFVLGYETEPEAQHYLNLYKLGEGPFYCFYTPYHLCHLEVHNTIARAALFNDAAIAPIGHHVDVITVAKQNLKKGDVLDGIGGYHTFGQAENAGVAIAEGILPIGISEGCVLKEDIGKDRPITRDIMVLPESRFIDDLRKEQDAHFPAL